MFLDNESSKKRRVAIYIRVSTAEQKMDGYGLEAQKSKLLAYINDNKALNAVTKKEWFFSDAHTGSDLNRTELNRLRACVVKKEIDAVLVLKIDRLSRSLKHLLTLFEEFKDHGVHLISVGENMDFSGPIGNLVFQLFGAIAQFERELIKGRTQMGILASAEMGNYTGSSIPYGYRPIANSAGKGKKLSIIPKEKEWIQEVFNWYIYDDMGYGLIASKLNELSVPKGECTRARNKYSKWTTKMIRGIISNSLYRGEFIANKTDDEGEMLPESKWTIVAIPPCISEFIFQQAQNMSKKRTGGKRNTVYLLSGKLRDMNFEKPRSFSGAKRSKGGFSYRRKQFNDSEGQHHSVFEFPGKQMDDFVWGKIIQALGDPEVFVSHYLTREYADPTKIEKLERQLTTLREERINIEVAISRIEEAYERGNYSEEKMSEKTLRKANKITQIDSSIQEIEDSLIFMGSIDVEVEKLKTASSQIKYRLEKLTLKQRKVLIDLFVDRIEMSRVKVEKRWKINAEIFFRFNPNKFPTRAVKGRTDVPHKKAKTSDSGDRLSQSGAGGQD